MPRKLILHPGCPKTGTSSIQAFLFKNRHELLNAGIYVPTFLQRNENKAHPHAWTSALSFDEKRVEPLVLDLAGGRLDDWHNLRTRKISELEENLSRYNDYTWIISDEVLAARMLDEGDLLRLNARFVNSFEECKIIFFIRNQVDSAVGQWSTDLINGSQLSRAPMPWDLPEDPRRYLDYKLLLSRWLLAFPGRNVTARLFKAGSIVEDFAKAADIPINNAHLGHEHENVSLPAPCFSLLSRYNQIHPFFPGNRLPSELRRYMPIGLSKAFAHYPKYRPSKDMVDAYRSHFRESNEWMREQFFPHLSELWGGEGGGISAEPAADAQASLPIDLEDAVLALMDDLTKRFQAASSINYRRVSRIARTFEWSDSVE